MSDFYGTASEFKTYHAARGRTVPVAWTDPVIESALLVASEWLDFVYDQIWFGYATQGFLQKRKWPRVAGQTNTTPNYVFTDSEIPTQVVNAVYEVAFREATSRGSLMTDYTPLRYKSATVNGAVSVDYVIPNDASETQTQMPIVGTLMAPLIDPRRGLSTTYSGSMVRV